MAIYLPRLGHEFVTDDHIYIAENPAVTQGAPLAAYFLDRATVASEIQFHTQSYRPLRTLAFRAVALTGGVRPLAFHAVNLTLYLGAIGLLFVLLARIGIPAPAAGLAVGLWALAPVHVESVLYASALGDQLSLVIELAALLLGLRALADGRLRWAALSVSLAFVAMLTKEMAITAAGLLALLALTIRADRRRTAWLVGAHAAAALAFLIIRTAVIGAVGHAPMTASVILDGLAAAPHRLGAYLKIIVAPLGHCPAYTLSKPTPLVMALEWVALGLAVWWLLRRGGRPRLAFGWFVLSLLPVLGLVPLAADMADRFALLPSMALVFLVPCQFSPRWRVPVIAGVATIAIGYGAATMIEAGAWVDNERLWRKAVAIEPRSSQARRNFGLVLLQAGAHERALAELDQAWTLGEQTARIARWRSVALEEFGRYREAETAAAFAAAADPTSPMARAAYGGLLVRRGDIDGAARELRAAQAGARGRDDVSALLLAIRLASAQGDAHAEVAAAERLIALHPREPRFRHRHAQTLLHVKRPQAAVDAARVCLRLSLAQPQCECVLGAALIESGGPVDEARRVLDHALGVLPAGEERTVCETYRKRL